MLRTTYVVTSSMRVKTVISIYPSASSSQCPRRFLILERYTCTAQRPRQFFILETYRSSPTPVPALHPKEILGTAQCAANSWWRHHPQNKKKVSYSYGICTKLNPYLDAKRLSSRRGKFSPSFGSSGGMSVSSPLELGSEGQHATRDAWSEAGRVRQQGHIFYVSKHCTD